MDRGASLISIPANGDTAPQKKGKIAEMSSALFGWARWIVAKYAPVCHSLWSAIGFSCL